MITDNIRRLEQLIEEIKAHPMCLSLNDYSDRFFVQYPLGMIYAGVQVRLCEFSNKITAARALLTTMEKHWQLSGVSG